MMMRLDVKAALGLLVILLAVGLLVAWCSSYEPTCKTVDVHAESGRLDAEVCQ